MRFRLKTDFLTFARDQIRGGLWYRPSWWEAAQRVPPAAFQPRIKKREIPRIRFLEDKLIKSFYAQNPMIAQFDRVPAPHNRTAADMGAVAPRRPVAALFAEKQAELMKEHSEKEAYALAQAWLLENGKAAFAQLNLPPALRKSITGAEEAAEHDVAAVKEVLSKQTAKIQEALVAGGFISEAGRGAAADAKLSSYRSFMPAGEVAVLKARRKGGERAFPVGNPATEKTSLGAAAAGASSSSSSSSGGASVEADVVDAK